MATFDQFFNKLMQAEGGYVNDPVDRGGETYAGVSARYFPKDVANLKLLSQSGKDTTPYLRDFYRREFWDKSGAENVPENMRLAYADTAVNKGINKAQELLSESGNVSEFLDKRQNFINQIVANDPSQQRFAQGWENRIDSLREPQTTTTETTSTINQDMSMAMQEPDFSAMSDDELLSMIGQDGSQDVTAMSDDDLLKLIGEKNVAQEPESDFLRTLKRRGRNVATSVAGIADLPLWASKQGAKNLASMSEMVAGDDNPLAKFARGYADVVPVIGESVQSGIDTLTGGELQPRDGVELASDIATEVLTPVGGAMALARKGVGGFNEYMPRMLSDDIKQKASGLYKKASELGGVLKPETYSDFVRKTINDITPKGTLAKSIEGRDEVTDVVESLKRYAGNPLSLEDLTEVDQLLTRKIQDNVEIATGSVNSVGKKYQDIQSNLRNMVENANISDVVGDKEGFEAMKEARKLWSRSIRLKGVEDIIENASMYDQPASAIRSQFRSLYKKIQKGKAMGYSKEEKNIIKKLAEGDNAAMDLLRSAGSRLTGIIAGASGGPASFLAAKGVEAGARGLRESVVLNQAENLAREVAKSGGRNKGVFSTPANVGLLSTGSLLTRELQQEGN